MSTIILILLAIIVIYLFKLINDYRNWVKNFYNYPSYSVTIKDALMYLSGPDFLMKKCASRDFFERARQLIKGEDYFVVWFGFFPCFFILNPNIAENAFKKHNTKTIFMSAGLPTIQWGLFMIPGDEKWKKFRKISDIQLKTKKLQLFFPIMSRYCDKMVTKLYQLSEDEWTDLNDEVGLTTFNVITECGVGVSSESPQLESTALKLFKFALVYPRYVALRVFNPLFWNKFIWTKILNYLSDGAQDTLEQFFTSLTKREITRQLTFHDNNNATHGSLIKDGPVVNQDSIGGVSDDITSLKANHIENNFLSNLVDLYLNQKGIDESISVEEIEAETNNFILAGYETVRTAILWTLACIACEPKVQQNIYDELIEVFGDVDGKWTFDYENMNQLKYLEGCIREGLRIFSPLQLLGRNSGPDWYQLDETRKLPPNSEYVIVIYSTHHNEEIYPEPEKFDPERWLGSRGESIPFNCWLPFGIGPRSCPGYRFAIYEMKILISSIVKHFHIYTDKHYDQRQWSFIIGTRSFEEINFRFKPRKVQSNQ